MSAAVEYITVSSADATNVARGTALGNAVFQNVFDRQLVLGDPDEYEVALFSITLQLATSYDVQTVGSTFLYSNFVDAQIVGSTQANLLRRFLIPGVGRTEINFSQQQFVPVAGSSFTHIEIALLDATGVPLPTSALAGTTVVLALRKKIYTA